jgi:hypothetical protein
MTNLKYTDKVKILEYKFVFEEEENVHREYQEGAADLNYRLSFFREKLDNTSSINNEQNNRYDDMFMGGRKINPAHEIEKIEMSESVSDTASAIKTNKAKPWAKKIYRQIVVITHPDKTLGIQSANLKEQLTEQYRIAQNAYNKECHSDLIMVAYDLNIDIPEGVVNKELMPFLAEKKKNVLSLKQKLGWQWYHMPEDKKDMELKKILVRFGFKFSDKQVEEAVTSKYIKRKTGTRPKKSFLKRRKNKGH